MALAVLLLGGASFISQPTLAADDDIAYFWCALHHSDGADSRNIYSNVFRGKLDDKTKYEKAYRAVIDTRILKEHSQGDVLCFNHKIRGEARREQNEYALNHLLTRGGTMQFIDWSY